MTYQGLVASIGATLLHASHLRSDAFALNASGGSPFTLACDALDRDDAVFVATLSILCLVVTLTSHLSTWRRAR